MNSYMCTTDVTQHLCTTVADAGFLEGGFYCINVCEACVRVKFLERGFHLAYHQYLFNTLLGTKGGFICTTLTPPKSATVQQMLYSTGSRAHSPSLFYS